MCAVWFRIRSILIMASAEFIGAPMLSTPKPIANDLRPLAEYAFKVKSCVLCGFVLGLY